MCCRGSKKSAWRRSHLPKRIKMQPMHYKLYGKKKPRKRRIILRRSWRSKIHLIRSECWQKYPQWWEHSTKKTTNHSMRSLESTSGSATKVTLSSYQIMPTTAQSSSVFQMTTITVFNNSPFPTYQASRIRVTEAGITLWSFSPS